MDGLQSNLLHCRWIRIISHSPTNNKPSTLSLLHTLQNSLAAWGTLLMLLDHPFIVNLWTCCNTWSDLQLVVILNSVFHLSETDKLLIKVCTAGSASSELSSLMVTGHMYVFTPSVLHNLRSIRWRRGNIWCKGFFIIDSIGLWSDCRTI